MRTLKSIAAGLGGLIVLLLFSVVHYPPRRITSFWDARPIDAVWWLIDHGIAFFR